MYSADFGPIFQKFPIVFKCFLGTFPFDEIPGTIEVNEFFIANTAPRTHEGKHWFLVHRPEHGFIEIFDSLSPSKKILREILSKFKGQIDCNDSPLMRNESTLCGEMCIYFAINRILNPQDHIFDILFEYFTTNLKINEERVLNFLKEI